MDEDDWDNAAPPLSRSDRIQRITSPEATLQRRPPHPPLALHAGSSNSLARQAQQQQLQLAAAIMQQQELHQRLLQQVAPGSLHQLDMALDHPALPPSHIATLRRQAQMMSLQQNSHTNSLPRSSQQQQQLFTVPISPETSHRALSQRYKNPSSLPPTTGPLRPAGSGPMSPNTNAARRMNSRLELQLEPQGLQQHLNSLPRRPPAHSAYWNQHDGSAGNLKAPYDGYAGAQQAIYSGDGSTSSYRLNNPNRQTYPPSQPSNSQTAEPLYNLQHDESTSLTSQKTARTQTSMLTKSAPTPSGSGSGSGASGSGSAPQQKQSDTTASTTMSASAKYAEYISNLEKYQHPPPSKRHVTFIKYRGRQCTIGMLVVFALLVIGLVVAPVVYFTAFANKTSTTDTAVQTRLTNFINGQITLDTTHGMYADLMTDPGRRSSDDGLKRVQRDMEDLLKDVLHGSGGFAADEVNSVMVSQPQRPETHQIFLRFQVLLKNSMPLDEAETKTSKAFASATSTDLVGTRLKDVPIVANSLFYRAVPQTNASSTMYTDGAIIDGLPDTGNKPSDLTQFDPASTRTPIIFTEPPDTTTTTTPATTTTTTTTLAFTPPPPAPSPAVLFTTTPSTTMSSSTTSTTSRPTVVYNPEDESFVVGGSFKDKKTTQLPTTLPVDSALSLTTNDKQTFGPSGSTSLGTTPALTTSWTKPSDQTSAGNFLSLLPVNKQQTPLMDKDKGTSLLPFTPQGFSANRPQTEIIQPPMDPPRRPDMETVSWNNNNGNFFPTSPMPRPPGAPMQEGPQFTSPQFVQITNPLVPPNPNFNNQFQQPPGMNNPNFPPRQFNQEFHPLNNFNTPSNAQVPFGQVPQGTFQFNGPPQGPFNRFAADDANAAATSVVPVTNIPSTESVGTKVTTTKSRVTSTSLAVPKVTTVDSRITTPIPDEVDEVTTMMTEGRVLLTEKREFPTVPPTANLPLDSPKKTSEAVSDATEITPPVVAPLLVSEWGNWSDWGSCSAPRCSSGGFQTRTRACMTSINGGAPMPDHDASCSVNGGQAIEARPCLCDNVPETSTALPVETTSSAGSGEFMMEESTTAVAEGNNVGNMITVPATTTFTTTVSNLGWSEWTDWSSCSIEPCHPNGIQTRHRTCKTDSGAGVQVPDEMCFSAEGASVETRPCRDCPVLVTPPQEESVTTPTFVRPATMAKGPAVPLQPQRTFNLQMQGRPAQRRPNTTTLPRTCSFYEKPCNNGQCILSYRICDGFPDCADGSDEPLGCGRCFSGEFKCTNGRCISESLVCDGTDNCGDGTDEFFC